MTEAKAHTFEERRDAAIVLAEHMAYNKAIEGRIPVRIDGVLYHVTITRKEGF